MQVKPKELIIAAMMADKLMNYEVKGDTIKFKGDWPYQDSSIALNYLTGDFIVAREGKIIATRKKKTNEKWFKELKAIFYMKGAKK